MTAKDQDPLTLAQIATFTLRLTGFSFLVDATINLTYLFDYLAAVSASKPGAAMDLHEFQAFMVVVRVLLLGVLGLIFLVFSKPLAKSFTRGLHSLSAEEPSQLNTWPPTPKDLDNI